MRKFERGSDTWEISVADAEVLIIRCTDGAREFETETCKSPTAAIGRAERLVASQLAAGFFEVEDEPEPEPNPFGDDGREADDDPFDGSYDISSEGAHIVLEHEAGAPIEGASLAGFRSVLAHVAETEAPSIRIEATEYEPERFLMEAMAEVELPSVRRFEFDAGESYGPDLGDLSALFECCPNLEDVKIQGGGDLRPFTANRLRRLEIWDGSLECLDEESGESALGAVLAKSRLPRLTDLSLSTGDGAFVTDSEVRAWLESAAPNLRALRLWEILDSGRALAGVLQARAPNLVHVSVGHDALDEFLEAIVKHGLPSHWKTLSLIARSPDDDDEAFDLFARAAESFNALEEFELRCSFGVDEDGTRTRLGALCPRMVYHYTAD